MNRFVHVLTDFTFTVPRMPFTQQSVIAGIERRLQNIKAMIEEQLQALTEELLQAQ